MYFVMSLGSFGASALSCAKVRLGMSCKSSADARKRRDELLTALAVADQARSSPRELSGGQQVGDFGPYHGPLFMVGHGPTDGRGQDHHQIGAKGDPDGDGGIHANGFQGPELDRYHDKTAPHTQ